ncbi:hypothetical protein MRX96_034186 [Rhipicephalus microplus]
MASCLKATPETVPGTLTTSVTTQRQLTSEVSSSGEVEATVAATAEEGIVPTERDSTAIANVAVGSASSSEPKTAEMGATASFNEEGTLRLATLTYAASSSFRNPYGRARHGNSPRQTTRPSSTDTTLIAGGTAEETARFYRALKVFGTDFDLMRTAFPNRTHKNLKNKFKREERENQQLVQKIINDPTKFNLEGFEDEFVGQTDWEPKQKRMKHGKEI